jgi:hypothetical protein
MTTVVELAQTGLPLSWPLGCAPLPETKQSLQGAYALRPGVVSEPVMYFVEPSTLSPTAAGKSRLWSSGVETILLGHLSEAGVVSRVLVQPEAAGGNSLMHFACQFKMALTESRTADLATPIATRFAASTAPPTSAKIEFEIPWVARAYELSKAALTAQALRVVYMGVEDLFDAKDLATLNRLLAEIEIDKLRVEVLTGLIRVTSRARLALDSWPQLLAQIKNKFETDNVPHWRRLLVGLEQRA